MMNNSNRKNQQGFTLIELLVVISIIGLLSSVVLTAVNSARVKAKNTKRYADKRQVVVALNSYYQDNGSWPSSAGNWACLGPTTESCWNGSFVGLNSINTSMSPYLTTFPRNGAAAGNYASDRMIYFSNTTLNTQTGAFLVWVQEGSSLGSFQCPSLYPVQVFDAFAYCFEYLGP